MKHEDQQLQQTPQGINDIADLRIHEASMLIGAAIKTLSDLSPHWEEGADPPLSYPSP